ncbi:MAG: membrane protein insertase YidC [bacterium]
MDNIRLFLILALAYVTFLMWQAWETDYGPQPAADVVAEQAQDQSVPDVPQAATVDAPVPTTPVMPEFKKASDGKARARYVEVTTDTLKLLIDTHGGSIVVGWLQQYPVAVDRPEDKFQLLGTSSDDFFIAQAGLLPGPTHEAVFSTSKDAYELVDGQDELVVDFFWMEEGVQVTKRFRFTRGSHAVELQHIVTNNSDEAWVGRDYRQLQRGEPRDSGNALMYTYTGGAVYSPDKKYQKYDFDELADGELNKDASDGWVAMMQHYFLAAIVPPREQTHHFYGKGLPGNKYVIGEYSEGVSVNPGSSHIFSGHVFIGPKDQKEMAELATGLDLTVDYGWLSMISQPMYWILDKINSVVNNWGWTIIIFTILIKAVFFKLSETSYRSMAQMRKLAPRMATLKERYGDDKQRLQQAMMEMYKKEKINPAAGCLPLLVQMPFFIALYWVLLESVELRQAPWILWLDDLSIKDPYFVLPLIMGATMFVQQKLNPPPPDPMQAKIMMALPIVFTAMFAFFPSGLVLYWVVNNLLSILQQWVITRRIEQGEKA